MLSPAPRTWHFLYSGSGLKVRQRQSDIALHFFTSQGIRYKCIQYVHPDGSIIKLTNCGIVHRYSNKYLLLDMGPMLLFPKEVYLKLVDAFTVVHHLAWQILGQYLGNSFDHLRSLCNKDTQCWNNLRGGTPLRHPHPQTWFPHISYLPWEGSWNLYCWADEWSWMYLSQNH